MSNEEESPIFRFNNLISNMKPLDKHITESNGLHIELIGTFDNGICMQLFDTKYQIEVQLTNVIACSRCCNCVRFFDAKNTDLIITYEVFSNLF